MIRFRIPHLLGRNFGAAFSALLRTIVELKLTSVDQLTYSEFVFSLENPTCFNLINAPPLEGQLILDINLSLLFPIIMSVLFGSFFIYGGVINLITRQDVFNIRDALGLRVSPEGERVLRSVKSRRTAWLAARLRGLSDEELQAVDAAIEPLQELIDE